MNLPEGLERKAWAIKDKIGNIQYKIWGIMHPKQAKEHDKQFNDFIERWFGND